MQSVTEYFHEVCMITLVLSALPLAASAVFGLVTALLQAVTQVQEQTCLYCVKLASVSIVFAAAGSWYFEQLSHLLRAALVLLPESSIR